jgi:hypothetical protein
MPITSALAYLDTFSGKRAITWGSARIPHALPRGRRTVGMCDLGGNDLEQQRDEFIEFDQQRAVRDMPYALIITGRWATEGFGTRTELASALA